MVAIPFPVISGKGAQPNEGGGRLINAIVEKLEDGAPARVVRKRAPGLNRVVEATGETNCRGMIAIGQQTLVAFTDRLYVVASDFSITDLGALDGDQPVIFARNNKSPVPDIACVTENGAFQVFTGAAPIAYPDPDVGSPSSVTFGDGYFFFGYGDGTILASDLNSTAINALNFTTAEAKADTLYRVVFFRQELFAFGSGTTEVYQNTANATGFPFSRTNVIPRGLVGKWAVAGFEDGWANTLIWVGDDGIVYEMKGYTPSRISTHDVERDIEAVVRTGDTSAMQAFVYMSEGHAFWALRGEFFCWVYDLTTGSWHERQSYELQTWRAQVSCRNYGLWMIGESESGIVYNVQADFYREGTQPMVWTVQSGHMVDFPTEVACPRADFYFDKSTGLDNGESPIETNPRVRVSWSNDGGLSFSQPLQREFGAQGEFRLRVQVNRTGFTGPEGRIWKLEVSDPVYVGLLSGDMQADPRK